MGAPKDTAAIVLHGINGLYHTLIAIFAVFAWSGSDIMNGKGWITLLCIALVVSIVESVVVFMGYVAGDPGSPGIHEKTKQLTGSGCYTVYHLIFDIFILVMLIIFFGNNGWDANTTLMQLKTPSAVLAYIPWPVLTGFIAFFWIFELFLLVRVFW
jgi:hypothetical protein